MISLDLVRILQQNSGKARNFRRNLGIKQAILAEQQSANRPGLPADRPSDRERAAYKRPKSAE